MPFRLLTMVALMAALATLPSQAVPYSVRWSTPPQVPPVSVWLGSFEDLNGDGQLETFSLFKGSQNDYAQVEIRGASQYDLLFTAPNPDRFDITAGPVSVATWNIDADPLPELIAMGIHPPTAMGAIRVYEWTGGVYQLKWQRTDLPVGFGLDGADMDTDGDVDIAVWGPGSCDIDLLDGSTGITQYTFEYPYSCLSTPGVGFGDVNSNGIPELMVLDQSFNGWVIESSVNLVGVPNGPPIAARSLTLGPPVPNPTSSDASLTLDLAKAGRVEADVIDASGRRIQRLAGAPFPPGRHALRWDGRDGDGRTAPAGVYWVEVRVNGDRVSRRVVRME